MAGKFSDEELLEYWKAFSVFDENGDGSISTEELRHVMESLGQKLSEMEIKAMIKEIDNDASGTVDFQEFLSLMVPKSPQREDDERLRAFEAFDRNGDGLISKEELKQGLEIIGEKVTEEELGELFDIIDTDKSGQIRYSEFVKLMTSSI